MFYQNKLRFNSFFSRYNLPILKDESYAIKHGE